MILPWSRVRRFRVLTLWLLLLCVSGTGQTRELPRYVRLTILHTNDVHGHIMPFGYYGQVDCGGIARRATLIDSIRSQNPGSVLVMDAGDVYTRGPVAEECKGEPDIAAMNLVPYDLMTLGNNEFKAAGGDEGQQIMRQRIKQARFPIVAANVVEQSSGKTLVPPYTILETAGLRVGIFGLTAPRVAEYSQAKGLTITDFIDASRKAVTELRDKADVIVGLTHIGYELDQQLAKAVPEIDVIVGGDSHTWLHEPVLIKKENASYAFWVGGPVIVQGGEWGNSLGRLDVYLRLAGEHDYQVMSYKGSLMPVTSALPARKDVEKLLQGYTLPYMKPVGVIKQDLSNKELGRWVAGLMQTRAGTDAAVVDPGLLNGNLKAGPVTLYDVRNLFAFGEDLFKVTLTGTQLRDAVKEIMSGETPTGVLSSDLTLSGAAVASGGELLLQGKAVEPSGTYTLASTYWLIQGNKALKDAKAEKVGTSVVDMVLQALKN